MLSGLDFGGFAIPRVGLGDASLKSRWYCTSLERALDFRTAFDIPSGRIEAFKLLNLIHFVTSITVCTHARRRSGFVERICHSP